MALYITHTWHPPSNGWRLDKVKENSREEPEMAVPSGNDLTNIAKWKITIEIVDKLQLNMVIVHSYVSHYQRVPSKFIFWGDGSLAWQ